MNEGLSLRMLQRFTGEVVVVDTPLGVVVGVFRGADLSWHRGVGSLLLETRSGWMLVKAWTAVKRR
jgi:hypothetical protein